MAREYRNGGDRAGDPELSRQRAAPGIYDRAVGTGVRLSEQVERLIYDWNVTGGQPSQPRGRSVELDDETLRDGLQSPSVTDPTIDEKVRILHFMDTLGINNADIGLPGAGAHVQKTVEILAREIVASKLSIAPSAVGRTDEDDIRPIIEISQRVGISIEADLFMMSSPIRQLAEARDIAWMVKRSTTAVRFAVSPDCQSCM
jgi:2-isopropylmalate synthase